MIMNQEDLSLILHAILSYDDKTRMRLQHIHISALYDVNGTLVQTTYIFLVEFPMSMILSYFTGVCSFLQNEMFSFCILNVTKNISDVILKWQFSTS